MDKLTTSRPAPAAAQCFHLRCPPRFQGMSRGVPARFPAARRMPAVLPRRRHHRPVEPDAQLLLAAGAQRRHSHDPRQGQARHARHLHPGQPRPPFRDHDGLSLGNVEIRREALHETADGRRFLVMHGDEFDSIVRASPFLESLGSTRLLRRAAPQPLRECGQAAARLSVLVRLRVPQAQGEERREVHRQFRTCPGGRSPAPRRRWRDLRAHPPCRNLRDRRHHLLQRRRLGGELHGARRGLPGSTEAAALDGNGRGAGRHAVDAAPRGRRPLEPAA